MEPQYVQWSLIVSTSPFVSTLNLVRGGVYFSLVGHRGLGHLKMPSMNSGSCRRRFSLTPQFSMTFRVAEGATRAMRSICLDVR